MSTYIKNIYELIDTEIPLWTYYSLIRYGKDNFDLDNAEYQIAIDNTKKACIDYYKK